MKGIEIMGSICLAIFTFCSILSLEYGFKIFVFGTFVAIWFIFCYLKYLIEKLEKDKSKRLGGNHRT